MSVAAVLALSTRPTRYLGHTWGVTGIRVKGHPHSPRTGTGGAECGGRVKGGRWGHLTDLPETVQSRAMAGQGRAMAYSAMA